MVIAMALAAMIRDTMRMVSGVTKMMIDLFFGSIAKELHAQLERPPIGRKAAATSSFQLGPVHCVITRPSTKTLSPLIQVVRALKLRNGNSEDEQHWTENLLLGVFLAGFLFGRGSRGH